MRTSWMCAAALAVAAGGALAACGGGGASSVTGATTSSTLAGAVTPTAAATSAALSAASAAYLNLDLTSLLNYAQPVLPAYYTAGVLANDNTPANNPTTNAGATLGRVLFNDPRLSTTGAISCATCHQQADGFTSFVQFNNGVLGTPATAFHTMRLGNVRYYQPGTMFWDKSAASVEAQAIVPIQNTTEMGYDAAHGGLTALETAMAALPYYPQLFAFVYGSATITTTGIQDAIAQYERAMITTDSLWDQGETLVYTPGAGPTNFDTPLPNFTAQQNRGLHLFMASPANGGVGCAACHQPPTFALAANSLDDGLDAGETTVFKAPSLKNDSQGFYMHDGRFSSLAQVVAHYNSGIQPGPELDHRLETPTGAPIQLNLSPADQAALVAFLQTLDDPTFFADPRFANPFKK